MSREEDQTQPASADPLATAETVSKPSYDTPEELYAILTERHQVDMEREDMDPLEWSVRKVVPIPAHYYWDVVPEDKDGTMQTEIPRSIRWWHNSVHAMANALEWTEQKVGLPLGRRLGLLSPRMSDVTMFMSDDDWKKSERIVTERKQAEASNGQHSSVPENEL